MVNKFVKHMLIILLLFTSQVYSLDKQNIDNQIINKLAANEPFNLNKFYEKNHYSILADENIIYEPAKIIERCPFLVGKIPLTVPPEQNPNLKISDCEADSQNKIHVQMAGGCDPDIHGEFGNMIKSSVVRVDFFREKNSPSYCSGTVIDQKWILSAAHCFMQPSLGGNVSFNPIFAKTPVLINGIYKVKTIYSPKTYGGGATINDYALLELENPLPSTFKPIGLESKTPQSRINFPVWTAGFGSGTNIPNPLRYIKGYYITNLTSIDSQNASNNETGRDIGLLYTSGTIPTLDPNSGKMIGWRFTLGGDSGGPVLIYTPDKTFKILGVLSSSAACKDMPILSDTPYNFNSNISMPKSYIKILNLIRKSNPLDDQDFVHTNIGEYSRFNIFTISNTSNKLGYNYINTFNGRRRLIEESTGSYPSGMAKVDKYIYVTNYLSNSISVYKINKSSVKLPFGGTYTVNIEHPTDIKIIKNILLATSQTKNKLFVYDCDPDPYAGMIFKSDELDTGISPISMTTTTIGRTPYIFVLNVDSSISAYSYINGMIHLINKNLRLKYDDKNTIPLKILANGEHIIVQDTRHISLYTFNINTTELHFKAGIPMNSDPKSNSDIAILPSRIPAHSLLAISYGKLSAVKIYDLDFLASTIEYNTTLPVKGTGLAEYTTSTGLITLHILNADTRQTVSVFKIYPQIAIHGKINFDPQADYVTIKEPTNIIIQPVK